MLLLYIRIFHVRSFRQICWIITGLNVAIFVSVVLATCLICRPITYSFDKTSLSGECGILNRFENYTAIISLIADTTIVILPMPMLWRLQMELRNKVGISIVLGMGTMLVFLPDTTSHERSRLTKSQHLCPHFDPSPRLTLLLHRKLYQTSRPNCANNRSRAHHRRHERLLAFSPSRLQAHRPIKTLPECDSLHSINIKEN